MVKNSDENIWLTSRTRMISEARCRRLGQYGNLLVAWYSLWLIGLTIYDLFDESDQQLGVALVILSVFVFALSLIMPSMGFEERASRFRECYLRLQRLLSEDISAKEKTQRYHDILEGYANHTTLDWDIMLVQAFLRKQDIKVGNEQRDPTLAQWIKVFGHFTLTILFGIALFLSPFLFLLWLK